MSAQQTRQAPDIEPRCGVPQDDRDIFRAANWVFVGSGYYLDERTGKKAYIAEGGDLICVSNFPDSMLDLAIKSTDKQNEGLLFEAWTEPIPPRGTDVTMELVPRVEKAGRK